MVELLRFASESFGNFATVFFFSVLWIIGLVAIVGSFKPVTNSTKIVGRLTDTQIEE